MKIGIYGYGNIARGVECAVAQNPDAELVAVFTRRDPASVHPLSGVACFHVSEVETFCDKIDVMILCGGSAKDLPLTTPALAKHFHVVDSFDTHAKIPEHFANVDAAARGSGHIAVLCGGWDPGLFSLARLYSSAVLPNGVDYTFWGRGVSQGHSDAIRQIPGVLDARQYTVPRDEAIQAVRSGSTEPLTTRQKHLRECYVVCEEGADRAAIEKAIVTMPNYFADYDTTVQFISMEQMQKEHAALPHGGIVIRNGKTGSEGAHQHTIEFRLKLDSNPEFTAGVLLALARAADRMAKRGETGARTIFDIAPADLSALSPDQLRAKLL